MYNDNFILRPIVIASDVIERVNKYRLLGVILRDDLKWNDHIDYIYKKACKRSYILRILKRVEIEPRLILKVYISNTY